jgi:phage terminase large subunit-like protein
MSVTAKNILRRSWSFLARDDQRPPPEPWQIWLFMAGRGSGKTRTGAEYTRARVKAGCRRLGLIAPTAGDCRDVMVEGSSGILAVSSKDDLDHKGNYVGIPIYEPSKRRVSWANGAVATMFSASEPERLRGPQHDFLWADELGAWQFCQDAWDMAMFGLRIGSNPQCVVTTTPRPIPVIRDLIKQAKQSQPAVKVTTATTYSNRDNLAPSFFDRIIRRYEGTRLGRQELAGELIEEAEGALWTREMVERARDGQHSDPVRTVVAIDPAVTANEISNLTGIVVASLGRDGRGYIREDLSGRYSPHEWAKVAADAYVIHAADRIVAEGNQGGDLVMTNIRTIDPNLPISIVHASRSKQARAEPVAALYEQKRITHCKVFPELDDQLCTWVPLSGDPSPDRLDAMVWAFTELMLGYADGKIVAPFYSGTPRRIPGI